MHRARWARGKTARDRARQAQGDTYMSLDRYIGLYTV